LAYPASHLTATIVRSYVRHHTVGADQVSDLIATVHRALGQLGQPTQPEEVLVPAVSVRRSVSPNEVVCMDCGWRGKTLRRHITTRHFLSRGEYLKRWGLRHEHPLTAPAYSERRSNPVLTPPSFFGHRLRARSCPRQWCKSGDVSRSLAGFGRYCQVATAGNLKIGSSLSGAIVSSVM
jgi:predicted transcriptional regulator